MTVSVQTAHQRPNQRFGDAFLCILGVRGPYVDGNGRLQGLNVMPPMPWHKQGFPGLEHDHLLSDCAVQGVRIVIGRSKVDRAED